MFTCSRWLFMTIRVCLPFNASHGTFVDISHHWITLNCSYTVFWGRFEKFLEDFWHHYFLLKWTDFLLQLSPIKYFSSEIFTTFSVYFHLTLTWKLNITMILTGKTRDYNFYWQDFQPDWTQWTSNIEHRTLIVNFLIIEMSIDVELKWTESVSWLLKLCQRIIDWNFVITNNRTARLCIWQHFLTFEQKFACI